MDDSPLQQPATASFQGIAQAKNESELRQPVMAALGQYFAANRWNLVFLENLPQPAQQTSPLMQRALSLEHNPVLRYLVERHAAVHEEVLLPPGVWQSICPRADHAHVMVGPVLCQGQLVGGIAFTRDRRSPAFNSENLADLSALSLHLSSRLEALRGQSLPLLTPGGAEAERAELLCDRLTPRETEIAALVAEGLTNKEIGKALWITENSVKQALKRMFRKLEVASRAEMVAQLYIRGRSPEQT